MESSVDLRGRDFLAEKDFTAGELIYLLDLAATLKSERRNGAERPRLAGRGIALIFEKTSTRTRIAFEAAIAQQGGFSTLLDPSSSQIGHKESIADTARVLSRVYDGIEYRGSAHSIVEELAQYADVPVFNGLTDTWHPTQMLADFLTMREHSTTMNSTGPLSYAYVGDARYNMGNSLLVTGAILGADVRIAAPRDLWPSHGIQAIAQERAAQSGARITITEDISEGVTGADFVHTDVWVSMGEPKDVWAERIELLRPYRVDANVMAMAGPQAKFMHCLPAFHDTNTNVGRSIAQEFGLTDGVEVTSEVFDSPASIVFDQAENRLHTIKAVLVATLGDQE
ncbi:MAG: ornithine carbamoyltransferase [Actinomycetota bacterium]|nr:ornithine carbamoyltransferase [Actinomycetota bacterium]